MFASQRITGKFVPLQDWIILKPQKVTEKEGILLPNSAHEYGACEVMAVGLGRRIATGERVPCDLKVGDQVFIQKFVDGEMKFLLNGDSVYAIRERYLNLTIDSSHLNTKSAPATKGRPKSARGAKRVTND